MRGVSRKVGPLLTFKCVLFVGLIFVKDSSFVRDQYSLFHSVTHMGTTELFSHDSQENLDGLP